MKYKKECRRAKSKQTPLGGGFLFSPQIFSPQNFPRTFHLRLLGEIEFCKRARAGERVRERAREREFRLSHVCTTQWRAKRSI